MKILCPNLGKETARAYVGVAVFVLAMVLATGDSIVCALLAIVALVCSVAIFSSIDPRREHRGERTERTERDAA